MPSDSQISRLGDPFELMPWKNDFEVDRITFSRLGLPPIFSMRHRPWKADKKNDKASRKHQETKNPENHSEKEKKETGRERMRNCVLRCLLQPLGGAQCQAMASRATPRLVSTRSNLEVPTRSRPAEGTPDGLLAGLEVWSLQNCQTNWK